jgi:glycosyltransferase involved in cell wall biosynthesis
VVSISRAQRTPLSWFGWVGNVQHGLPRDLFRLEETPGDYLAVLGRISPEKGVDRAIEIAGRAGLRIRIAAKVDSADRPYHEQVIQPLLRRPAVEYLGEIGEGDKQEFLGNARALLFPIDWPEPFGMVMIEALACGTPVIAYPRGSVPEVVTDGVTGFIVHDVNEAVAAVARIDQLDRARIREVFEQRFTATRMAGDYLTLYQRLVQKGRRPVAIGRDMSDITAQGVQPAPVN